MIKYIVYGMPIISNNDGQRLYIGAYNVAKLYKISPRECILIDHNDKIKLKGLDTNKYIELYPVYDGNYSLG
jgi:hypothetical protein|nr:MAG TPA: hypothetical protein [Caudoviricetes sp.]